LKVFRDLFRDYRFALSFCVLCILLLYALLSFFSPYDPTLWGQVPRDLKPSRVHLLGTNSKG
jgi:peptide/nickel transport system permease protein